MPCVFVASLRPSRRVLSKSIPWFVVRGSCLLGVVRFVGCFGLLFWFIGWGLLFFGCCILFVVCCFLVAIFSLWFVVCSLLFMVFRLWFVVCSLLFVVCGLWFFVCS